jgi:23S rRNA (guanine745-N1)-methyltransferase
VIADIGCGEGYYSSAIAESTQASFCGIDISKDALRYASKELKNSEFAVASAFDLPFTEGSVDCVLNIFAPSAYEEFHRILKNDGALIKAVPLSEHLWGLKCALYDKPYPNKPELRNEELFELVSFEEIKYEITLTDSDDIQNLFKMTPYYYKTGRNEAERLLNLKNLTTTVHFGVEVYRKR